MFALPVKSLKDKVPEDEWLLRIDLAACYRIAHYYQWDDTIYTHISAKLPNKEEYLVNAYGLFFDEVCASNLVKVNIGGEVLSDTRFSINPAGFTIHSAIHQARPDVQCVMHLHTNETIAVASMEEGLKPISQHSLFPLTNIAYHDYEGLAVSELEKKRLQKDLGNAHTMLLPNHGALTVGETVGGAFMRWYDLQRACEIQLLTSMTNKKFRPISSQIRKKIKEQQLKVHHNITGGQLCWPAVLRKVYRLDPTFAE